MSDVTQLGKYQPYPDYKNSGVEWLGEIPDAWELWKLAHAYDVIGSGTTPPTNEDKWFGDGVPWVTTGELRETVVEQTTKNVTFEALNQFSALKIHPAGSVVIAMYGATIGRLGVLGIDATTNQACCVLTQSQHLYNQYVFYWLYAFRDEIIKLSSGGGQPNINQEKVASLKITAPDYSHQKKIVSFLDYETARIDQLIAKQQQLIELLKEKRQAVISHAVTKGLNPNAPMKDSGVEWLGQVPEHWRVSPLKYECSFSGGGTPSKENLEYWDGEIPWVSPKDMKSFWITDSEDKITEQAIKESSTNLVKPGAVLMVVRSGILQRTIPVGINTIPVTINQDMKAIRCSSAVYAELLTLFIKGHENSLLLDWRKQGATVESIEHEYLANALIPFPPEDEAIDIIRMLSLRLKEFDLMELRTSDGISLLQERRTALISAAVTGKIDLRGWQPPKSEVAA